MEEEKTKEGLLEEIRYLKEELKKTREELELQTWGLKKTNEAIKTLYKELERKNRELQKLDQLKSDFVYAVSHELRTPLTTVREAVFQVWEGILGPTTPEQRELLSICLEDIDRLKRIINDLLDAAKLEAGKMKLIRDNVDLAQLARRAITSFQLKIKNKNLEARENIPPHPVMVYIDKDRIMQVFTNLIGNALKFTEKGYIEVSIVERENFVECSVRDTGRGISEEDLPKVFGKFQQFNRRVGPGEKGTGLGLSICKGIIELHRGSIWVESPPSNLKESPEGLGKGTRFAFTIPRYSPEELLKLYLEEEIEEATSKNSPLSIIVFEIKNLNSLIEKFSKERIDSILQNLERLIQENLRRQGDKVLRSRGKIFCILPETKKNNCLRGKERIKEIIDRYLSQEGLIEDIDYFWKVINYPEDSWTKEEIFAKINF